MAEEQLKLLISRRSTLKAALKRFKAFVDSFGQNGNIFQLKARLPKLETTFNDFESNQNEIFKLDSSAKQTKESDEFETMYYDLQAAILEIIQNKEKELSNQQAASSADIVPNSNVRLPQLSLPIFKGTYSDWSSFHDTFKALIHDSKAYTNIEKFHYLRSCLRDDAFKTIDTVSVSEVNYSTAWSTLKDRFENKRLIVQEHVLKIINSPTIVKNSHTALRRLVDDISINLAALSNLEQPTDKWDALLVPIITSKFDFYTKRDWEQLLSSEVPTYQQLIKFLEKKCLLLESMNASNKSQEKSNFSGSSNIMSKPKTASNLAVNNNKSCFLCRKSHYIYKCPDFIKLSIPDRINQINSLKLCSNCFRNNHTLDACLSRPCKYCNLKHNSMIHNNHINNYDSPMATISNHSRFVYKSNEILLSTALILVKDNLGEWQTLRALLDVGSQSNFITRSACDKLKLPTSKARIPVLGINDSNNRVDGTTHLEFKSLYDPRTHYNITCLLLSKITQDLPLRSFNINQVKVPSGIRLADQTFNMSLPIDILLGAEIFWQVLGCGHFQERGNTIHFQETALGWILGGKLVMNKQQVAQSCCNLALNKQLNAQVQKFWQLDNLGEIERPSLTQDEILCEQLFQETTSRHNDGRFEVQLPVRPNAPRLGHSKAQAIKQFYSLERRLNKDPGLKQSYTQFINEYRLLGHMIDITETESDKDTKECFYLPHHAVIKPSSTTTKLRVVFNGSAKSSSGHSLNDTLLVGPNIQEELFTVLIRFRTYKYAFTADIVKMYRQILLNPKHCNYQRIVWRDDQCKPLQEFALSTVTYGISSSSFLAIRCLHQLAFEESNNFPLACKAIMRDFYVDDILSGGNDLAETIKLKNELITVLSKGKMSLQKWASNNNQLTNAEDHPSANINLNKQEDAKILGLIWGTEEDTLKYSLRNCPNVNTKRGVLSAIAQLFDPLGLIGPVLMTAKIILQKLWSLKVSWDEPIPEAQVRKWQQFVAQLPILKEIQVDRKIIDTSCDMSENIYELHGFCDASESGYGACVYLRSKTESGVFSANLICGKSRVAPLKTVTIPRLELCGALLLSQLLYKVKHHLNVPINQCYYWTDSTVVLCWLRGNASDWKVFVAHRVAEIQTLSNVDQWHHVSSNDNPADLLSRGVAPNKLIAAKIWWHGPSWLSLNDWPHENNLYHNCEVPDQRIVTVAVNNPELPIFTRFSSFKKLQRVISYCLRFIHKCRYKSRLESIHLSVEELDAASITIIRYVQSRAFTTEFNQLSNKKSISSNSHLQSLKPFMDENQLIRVGGRLRHAEISYQQRFPIVLPKHHITNLLIKQEHETQLHSGPLATLAALRQKYWPLSARNQIRKVIRQCIPCFRVKPRYPDPIMGDIPANRFNTTRPFYNCGVDYMGPVSVKEGGRRSKRVVKAYVALFVCFATKAIHLELVSDLTAECFLNALKRFISRRGIIKNIYSDNATNFVGANRELISLSEMFKSQCFQREVIDNLATKTIKWHFIPSRAPHFGGIWEAGVKSVKGHLRRVLGNSLVTYEEIHTLLTCIEACLNSRPLCPLSDDPNELDVLTPGHFLIGGPLTAPAEPSILQIQRNKLSRWQYIEQLRQHFWKRWSREYLSLLQQRTRWRTAGDHVIKPGALVLLKEDNLQPLMWKMARITDVHPGDDGVVRVVTVKTRTGLTKRAIRYICLLPVD